MDKTVGRFYYQNDMMVDGVNPFEIKIESANSGYIEFNREDLPDLEHIVKSIKKDIEKIEQLKER